MARGKKVSSSPTHHLTYEHRKPSLGVALILNFALGLIGVDRFYVGGSQVKYGALTLLGTLILIGIPLNVIILFITQLSICFSILVGRNTSFMYGKSQFENPTSFDKIVVIVYLVLIVIMFLLFGVSSLFLGF